MRNGFKGNCMEMICSALSDQKYTKRIRIFSNVFFSVISLGVTTACVIFEIPYVFVTEIINEHKHNS